MIEKAVEILKKGGIVLYPTDTLYALGVDFENEEAVQKLRTLKGRYKDKPIPVMVSDISMARKYVKINDLAEKLITKFLPGKLTLVLPKIGGVEMGIRIPNNVTALELVRKLGRPITVTSANLSGEKTFSNVRDILDQLGSQIDYVIDEGIIEGDPSTIVDLTDGFRIQREGAISKEELTEWIK